MYSHFNRITLTIFILFVLLIPLLIAGERRKGIDLPDFSQAVNLLDKPLSGQSYCDYTHVMDNRIDCSVYDDDIFLSYNTQFGIVTETTKMIYAPLTIGDMVIAWGNPDGVLQSDYGVYVTWTNRDSAAYINTQKFNPADKVGFVTFWSSTQPRVYEPWHGFTYRSNNGK